MSMMHHKITDTAQDGSSNGSHSPGSHDDQLGVVVLGDFDDIFTWVREFPEYRVFYLKTYKGTYYDTVLLKRKINSFQNNHYLA